MKEKSIVDTIAEIAKELPKRDLRALERKDIAIAKALERQAIANAKKEWVAVPETVGLIHMEITEAPPIEIPKTKSLCGPDTHCPTCSIALIPEHAHMTCPKCHYRDSCCF